VFRFGVTLLSILLVLLVASSPGAEETGPTTGAAPEPDPAAVIAELPFERPEAQNRVYVDLAREGSRPLMLMLDTGATFSVMTPRAARALGISVRRLKNSPYRRATRLGRSLQFWVDDLISDTSSRTGWEYRLLGGNFLEHYVVELDFGEHRVRFLDPKRYRVPERVTAPDEAVIPMRLTRSRPYLVIELDGKKLQVLIDTGAPLPFYLSGKEAKRLGLDPDSLPYFGHMGTTVGDIPSHIGEVDSLRAAGFELGRVPVVVEPHGSFNLGGSSESLIGYDLLQQFQLRLDYPRGRLWLKRRGDSPITFYGADYESMRGTGIYLGREPGKGWVVASVMPGSSAERLGLMRDDIIVGWEGEPSTPSVERTIQRIDAGGEIVVARRQESGTWLDVTLGRPEVASEPSAPGPLAAAAEDEESIPSEAVSSSGPVAEEVPAPRPVRTAEEERAAWQERMSQRLYVFENGGWAVVDGWRRRIGPREGEVWVSYEEMLEMKRTGRVPEGASD